MPTLFVPGKGAVTYNEKVPGSPVYSLTPGGARVDRTFICPWVTRMTLAQGLLGWPSIVNTVTSPPADTYISRHLPDAMLDFLPPYGKPIPWLYASQITRMVGVGELGTYDGGTGVSNYQYAELQVSYEAFTYNILSDAEVMNFFVAGGGAAILPDESQFLRYVTRQVKPSAEFVQLPRGLMRWVDVTAKDAVDFATAQLLPSKEIVWTWHQVPFIPDAMQNYVGTVNSTLIKDNPDNPADPGYNPGSLLLTAAEQKPYRHPSGVFVNDITYRLKYFEPVPNRGHNFFFRYKKSTSTLYRTKITHNGNNDSMLIPGDGIDDPTQNPYFANVLPNQTIAGSGDVRPGKALYSYNDFHNLFYFHHA